MKALFSHAVRHQPAIIFIDEIDGITRATAASDKASTFAIQSTLRSEWAALDHRRDRVIVLGTSSHPESIDVRFLQRLTMRLWIRSPEWAQRQELLKDLLSRIRHDIHAMELHHFWTCNETEKFTGFHLAECVRSAIRYAELDLYRTNRWARVSCTSSSLIPQ